MSISTTRRTTESQTDLPWLRLIHGCVVVGVVSLVLLAYLGTFQTTISDGGDFKYTADYWYTGVGLPIALVGIGLALGVHRLQHGLDGRLGRIGVWINTLALATLFVQLSASLLAGAEVQWGPSYILATLLTFIGTALLAAGSWRAGLVPAWMLGAWPVVWILGSFAAQGPTPLLLAGFLVAVGVRVARQVPPTPGDEPVSGSVPRRRCVR